MHCSDTRGKAAYFPNDDIFHVIADFYSTQVVVFYWDDRDDRDPTRFPTESSRGPQQWTNPPSNTEPATRPPPLATGRGGVLREVPYNDSLGGLTAGLIQREWTQPTAVYSYRTYGAIHRKSDGEMEEQQILLATNDWQNYDPVIFMPPPFLEHDESLAEREEASHRMPKVFRTAPGYMLQSAWWRDFVAGRSVPSMPPIHIVGPKPYQNPEYLWIKNRNGATGGEAENDPIDNLHGDDDDDDDGDESDNEDTPPPPRGTITKRKLKEFLSGEDISGWAFAMPGITGSSLRNTNDNIHPARRNLVNLLTWRRPAQALPPAVHRDLDPAVPEDEAYQLRYGEPVLGQLDIALTSPELQYDSHRSEGVPRCVGLPAWLAALERDELG